jgi:hypothetical protein
MVFGYLTLGRWTKGTLRHTVGQGRIMSKGTIFFHHTRVQCENWRSMKNGSRYTFGGLSFALASYN